jgi:hypothetical protein
MKKHNLLTVLFIGIILSGIFVFQGCPNKIDGNENPQVAPSIYWADVTIDTSYNANPNLRWFSTDQDGLVIDYQYAVILASTVDSIGGPQAVINNFPVDLTWTIVHKDSSTIQLYASPDTSIYVPQYVFLRAMDDDSLYSPVIYKYMRRNNHPPTCYVILPYQDANGNGRYDQGEPAAAQWCLPETTTSWKGIRVAWIGKDSIDIPGLQPDFQWNVRLYGPFADSASCDTLMEHIYTEFINPLTGTNWIPDKQKYLRDLETGWYMISVRNRDDAFVSSVPAIGRLVIYEPTWIRHPEQTKPILIADHNWYTVSLYTANELKTVYRDSVNQYYLQMMADAGYGPDQYDYRTYTVGNQELQVPIADLYNHSMVIVFDTDINRPLKDDRGQEQESMYANYLAVGGKVWIIGRRTFDPTSGGGRTDFGLTGQHSIAFNYFKLSAAVFHPLGIGTYDQAEFAGAASINPLFPDVTLDSMRVRQTNWVENGVPHNFALGLPGVDFLITRPGSETIYLFNSLYPDTSSFQNFPVAVRYNQGSYKTSYFCFPLYFIQYDQAVAITRTMLDWFFQED